VTGERSRDHVFGETHVASVTDVPFVKHLRRPTFHLSPFTFHLSSLAALVEEDSVQRGGDAGFGGQLRAPIFWDRVDTEMGA